MSDATDINSLPVNPSIGNNNGMPNIIINKNEIIDNKVEQLAQAREQDLYNMKKGNFNNDNLQQVSQGQYSQNQNHSEQLNQNLQNNLDQNVISKLISGLQQASVNGLTSLPSSHIPLDTSVLTRDPQTIPNYVPPANNVDYIKNDTTHNDIMSEHMRKQNRKTSLDVMYDELQIPILIAILYFAFQLPIVRKYCFVLFPYLFNKDGNPKLSGYVFNSIMFALIFYIIKNVLEYLTNIE